MCVCVVFVIFQFPQSSITKKLWCEGSQDFLRAFFGAKIIFPFCFCCVSHTHSEQMSNTHVFFTCANDWLLAEAAKQHFCNHGKKSCMHSLHTTITIAVIEKSWKLDGGGMIKQLKVSAGWLIWHWMREPFFVNQISFAFTLYVKVHISTIFFGWEGK